MEYQFNTVARLMRLVEELTEQLEVSDEILDTLFEGEEVEEILVEEKKKWIQQAIKKEGALRKTMKTKKGKTIPVEKLKAAAKKGGKTGKRARLALTLRKLKD